MRKTARTVVWEGRQAYSCRLDPILGVARPPWLRKVIMSLRFKAKSKEEIPAEQQALYTERQGEWGE